MNLKCTDVYFTVFVLNSESVCNLISHFILQKKNKGVCLALSASERQG
jgi:hypothetical protein